MKLNHIALNIDHTEDITDFYQNIFGLELVNQFELPRALGQSIFGINHSLPAYFCKNEHIAIEMFVLPEKENQGVAHV